MLEILHNAWVICYTLILALFLFGLTVFVHEFGHFIVARLCGLKVLTFSIGFGKAIVSWTRDDIVYKIGWIPFGGYVALPQLDPEGMERIQGGEPVKHEPVSPWKKIAVSVAGPVGNILFAILIAVVIWLAPGDEAGTKIRPVIGSVETNSAAYAAGLREGDEILAVNGTSVATWYDYSVETLLQGNDTVALTVRSADVEKEVSVPVVAHDGGERSVEGLYPAMPCIVGEVVPDTPAEYAGVLPGDVVLSYNGQRPSGWLEFTEMIQATESGTSVMLVVERDGEVVSFPVAPKYREDETGKVKVMLGVGSGGGSGVPWMHYRSPLDQIKYDALAIVRVLQALTTPAEASNAAKSVGGPLGIFDMLMLAIRMGFLNTLGLVRLININLAVMNLLPIPVLDGGHIMFSLWEGITRRKVNAKVQAILINACAILLIGAMLLITFNDIDRKIQVKKFFRNLAGQTEAIEDAAPADGE